jgi:Flp pilus assembly protein TadD
MFEKSLEVNPTGVVPRVMLARILNEGNNPSESLQFLQKSVERDPTNPTLRTQLANAYRLSGKEDQALQELDRAIELAPMAAGPSLSKAHILLTRGKTDAAIALLRKALRHESNADAHDMLGAALARKGEIAQALEEFWKAYRLNPSLEGLRDNIANALMDMNGYQKAQEFCSSAQKSGMPCSKETLERLRDSGGLQENASP